MEQELKQKQINFLGNALYNLQEEYDMSNPFEVAKIIINAGYRKIPENAVVLTREELNDLEYKAYTRGVNSFNTLHEKQLAKVRKKTDEKIAMVLLKSNPEKESALMIAKTIYAEIVEKLENRISGLTFENEHLVGYVEQLEEQVHKAKVLERALKRRTWEGACGDCKYKDICGDDTESWNCYEVHIQQAEKEISNETV